MSLPTTSNVTRPRAFGFDGRLDDLYLRFSVSPDSPLDIVTADLQAPTIDTAQNAEDIRNEFGRVFSRVDFTGGEGLDKAHKPNLTELDRTRFWDSKHIDVPTPTRGQDARLLLLPPTENIETSTDTNLHLAWDGTRLFMAEGTGGNTRKSTDPTVASPSFADSATGVAATVLDLTTLGAIVYSAQGASGIRTCTAGVWAAMSVTTHTTRVWGVKRQLLCASTSDGSKLASVTLSTAGGLDGTHTILVSLAAGQEFRDVGEAGHAVLACADDGAIYALGFDESGAAGGTLELKAQTPVGRGEVPYAVEWDGTHVFYATREVTPSGAIGRLYRADLADGSYVLTGSELLRQWGDQSATIDHCPRAIRATRDAVFIGVYESDGSYLWRYDRASGGLTRHLDLGASGIVVDLLAISGRLFATVSAHGLRREKVGSYETDGYLIGPLADFFNASPKSWAGGRIEHDPIVDDERIELYYTTDPAAMSDPDSPAWVLLKNIQSSQDTGETVISGIESRYLAGMVKVYANSDADTSPAVRSYAFRAYPGDGDVEVTVDVAVSDIIERPGFRRQRVTGLGDEIYARLQGREGTSAEMEIFRPSELLQGVVVQVGTRVPAIVRRGATTDTCRLRFRGRRIGRSGGDVAESAMGIAEMGLIEMGSVA
jgi:hypothetical protein